MPSVKVFFDISGVLSSLIFVCLSHFACFTLAMLVAGPNWTRTKLDFFGSSQRTENPKKCMSVIYNLRVLVRLRVTTT